MRKTTKTNTTLSDFDRIVREQMKKSVVVAPSDPNGGAKLPKRQRDTAKRKKATGTQYLDVFDREAEYSNNQLDEWMKETNATTQSLEHFVNDDDDTIDMYDDCCEKCCPRCGHECDEDCSFCPSCGCDLGCCDDNCCPDCGEECDADCNFCPNCGCDMSCCDDDCVSVRSHKRKKISKSNHVHKSEGDMDGDFADLSDETEDDDDLDEGYDDKKEKNRRKKVRKALGTDAMKYVDGSPLVKALINRIEDMNDNFIAEIRALRLENKKMKQMVRNENRQMAKALVTSQAQFAGLSVESQPTLIQQQSQPIRKGYGLPVQTTQRPVPHEFNLAKSLDVLEEAYQKGIEGITMRDVTILENDRSPLAISNAAQEVLRKAKLL